MTWQASTAAAVFVVAFVLLAAGRVGSLPLRRGPVAAVAGIATAWLLGLSWHAIDVQILALLAGLMLLAGLAEATGLFAPLRRLQEMPPVTALRVAVAAMMLASAALLNDAAVVVLVPILVPVLLRHGLDGSACVVLLAIAANVGSLLTPFGNPQNAVLAQAAGLGVLDFLRQQTVWVVAGGALLWWMAGRVRVTPAPVGVPPADPTMAGRPVAAAAIVVFLALAAASPWTGLGLGWTALASGAAAAIALANRPATVRAGLRRVDGNVLLLFIGLYWLTAGLPAWFPAHRLSLGALDAAAPAATVTMLLSNSIGNVPAMLTYQALDAEWTAAHAPFLVTVSTLAGSLLVSGSAATLLAADAGRRLGCTVGFWQFARRAAALWPLLGVAAWVMW